MATFPIPALGRELPSVEPAEPRPRADGPGTSGFAGALGRALEAVDGAQLAADRQAESVALGGGNLHEVALALEKADVAMKVAVKARNKLVEAYQEIMRMSV